MHGVWCYRQLACIKWIGFVFNQLQLFPAPHFQTENPQFPHVGEVIDGVDMRAEVGVLTRNILIKGETEDTCYREKECQFFNYDTFGGHIKV